MAGQDAGDDNFSDTDLDTLPQNALDELEHNAIRYTQHQTQATEIIDPSPSSDYGDVFDDEDLDDAVVLDTAQDVPERFQSLQLSSNHAAIQGEHLGKDHYSGSTNARPLNDGSVRPGQSSDPFPVQATNAAKFRPSDFLQEQQLDRYEQEGADSTIEALYRRIQDLTRERDNLKQDNTIKTGEISIVRSKQEKTDRDYERELAATRNLNAEKFFKQQEATRAAEAVQRKTATELEFVRRDLLEEVNKVRRLERGKEKERDGGSALLTTPKKHKSLPYRDGFDDDEIIISPSKSHARRSNPSTPTKAGAKRKRKVQDSPGASLEVEQVLLAEAPLETPSMILDEALLERIRNTDDRLNFLELVFDHRTCKDSRRTLEEFTQIAFPAEPEVSFASIILGELPTLNSNRKPLDFPIDFCELLISLWKRCLDEKYHKPLHLLLDLLTFCLELKTTTISPTIIERLLPVVQDTICLVAVPRFSRNSCSDFENDINITECLTIMHLAASGCINSMAHTIRFWRAIRYDFVLMMLSPNQVPEDFYLMLQLLSMSVMKESVGPLNVDTDSETQQDQAHHVIERTSLLLISTPTNTNNSKKHDPSIIFKLRIQILRTLEAFCLSSWGGAVIAVHPNAIGRVAMLMSNELDAVYDYGFGHEQSVRLVCLAVRLLHHLTTKYDRHINMQQKLSKIHGGNYKYLICLARLDYSEDGLVLEAGIGPEIQECVHEMLELAVTPEEGEAIHSAFSKKLPGEYIDV